MLPEVFYFAAYVCVLDEKNYDECYFKIMSLIEKEENSTEIGNELLKILGDTEDKISLETIKAAYVILGLTMEGRKEVRWLSAACGTYPH